MHCGLVKQWPLLEQHYWLFLTKVIDYEYVDGTNSLQCTIKVKKKTEIEPIMLTWQWTKRLSIVNVIVDSVIVKSDRRVQGWENNHWETKYGEGAKKLSIQFFIWQKKVVLVWEASAGECFKGDERWLNS